MAGAIAGLLSYLFGRLDMLFTALLVCIAVDYITGVLAALMKSGSTAKWVSAVY